MTEYIIGRDTGLRRLSSKGSVKTEFPIFKYLKQRDNAPEIWTLKKDEASAFPSFAQAGKQVKKGARHLSNVVIFEKDGKKLVECVSPRDCYKPAASRKS